MHNQHSDGTMALAGMAPPDTATCRAAMALARRLSAPFLFNHVMRSWAFAAHAGRLRGQAHDPEILFLATVLHDLGLTEAAPGRVRFEVEGADAARDFLARLGVAAAVCDRVWNAIALHTTPDIAPRMGPEAALCQLGTAIDVGVVPPEALTDGGPAAEGLVAELLAAYPRLGFKAALQQALTAVAARNPAAALASPPMADAAERHLPGFRRVHFCDIVDAARFAD